MLRFQLSNKIKDTPYNKRRNIPKGKNNYNLYAPNVSAPNLIKHTLKDLKAYIDSNTVVVGDFNTPITIERSSKQNINKKILEFLNHTIDHTIDQMDLVNAYRIFHELPHNVHSLSSPRTFSKIDYVLGHKASLSKYKKIEIIPCILSDHNALKLELNNRNNRKKTCKQLEAEQHIAQ
jgi:endonuclease/exonuclease/phosphatase family metal-dependent hydrolase